ncbi:hypothetical protein CDN99_06925 [Roseateles aquatilis]|uniref:AttH domain-containing protein n=1 Tax=Roseateles aquatilis TaxID=431061 RepID=A0A246JHT2_9BURK|nr:carotenoid 1,2-hydratase [Roseateles aquatilis]OWQ92080.1 hypothetical protein CDN99_06925 [Roseateles aquatilis]
MIARRPLLLALGAAGLAPGSARARTPAADSALSNAPLRFPRDHGSHPETRVEWWYVTGVLRAATAASDAPPDNGFQLTFFRVRNDLERPLDSAFAPDQLMLGHAAVSDLGRRRLLHDQRVLRHGFANARTEIGDTAVRLGDWQLRRLDGANGHSRYTLVMHGETAGFALSLSLQAPQAPLLQGQEGWSRKGPGEQQASRYVSEPQLSGTGKLALRDGGTREVQARCWLDHEWSNLYLGRGAEASADSAVGWDWLGLNLDDGSAMTLFQMRGGDGAPIWTGGSWRGADGRQVDFQQQLRFEPLAFWRSPVSLATYPVKWRVRTPRGVFLVEAAYDAQEIDGRRSTGFLYWEGVSRLADESGRTLGWGYLEMTGYAGRVPL